MSLVPRPHHRWVLLGVLLLVVVGFPGLILSGRPGRAAREELTERVKDSDVIVIGTLSAVARDTMVQADGFTGTITVEEVLWGGLVDALWGLSLGHANIGLFWAAGDSVFGPPGAVDPGGRSGVWLLVRCPGGVYRPLALLGGRERGKVAGLIRKHPVLIRQPCGDATGPAHLSLVFRNAYPRDALVPDFRLEDQRLLLHPRVELDVQQVEPIDGSLSAPLPARPGAVSRLDPIDEMVIISGEEQVVPLDLRHLFPLEGGAVYQVTFRIRDYGEDSIRITPP